VSIYLVGSKRTAMADQSVFYCFEEVVEEVVVSYHSFPIFNQRKLYCVIVVHNLVLLQTSHPC
jgi:hypothetical protein